jgi:hypothetical protein
MNIQKKGANKMQENDRLHIKFEVIDNFVDGGTEKTVLEKDTVVISGIETHIDKVIDNFANFLITYGYQENTIVHAFEEFIEYKKGEL